jgi:hypothetical protein
MFVSFAWIFFRVHSIGDAFLIVKKIFTSGFTNPNFPIIALSFCLIIWIYQFMYEFAKSYISRYSSEDLDLSWGNGFKPSLLLWLFIRFNATFKVIAVIFMILYMVIFTTSGNEAFIYFQF